MNLGLNLIFGGGSGRASPFGPNQILNGGFDTGANWTPTGGWSISGGAARQALTGFNNLIGQAQTFIPGATYRITYTITSITSGTILARFSGGTFVAGPPHTAPGTYTFDMVAATGNNQFEVFALANTVAVVDDVSMRRVL